MTKRVVKELEIEKQSLINEIKDLRQSIQDLTEQKAKIQSQIADPGAVPFVERRKVIIEELLIDCDEEEDSKAFDEYFSQEDAFVSEIRQALLED